MTFCSKCGNELKSNEKFCSKCGAKKDNKISKKKNKQDYEDLTILFLAVCNFVLSPFLACILIVPFGILWLFLGLVDFGSGGASTATQGLTISQFLFAIIVVVYFVFSVIWLIKAYIKSFKSLKTSTLKIIVIFLSVVIIFIMYKLIPSYKEILEGMLRFLSW